MNTEKLKERYGKSEHGNFAVADTIGVPHPYCITAKHVCHAADHFHGMLGEAAIESAEKLGIRCGTRGCTLSFAEHKQALLIECCAELHVPIDGGAGRVVNPELNAYLLASVDKANEDKYEGFTFIKVEKL